MSTRTSPEILDSNLVSIVNSLEGAASTIALVERNEGAANKRRIDADDLTLYNANASVQRAIAYVEALRKKLGFRK